MFSSWQKKRCGQTYQAKPHLSLGRAGFVQCRRIFTENEFENPTETEEHEEVPRGEGGASGGRVQSVVECRHASRVEPLTIESIMVREGQEEDGNVRTRKGS